MLEQRIIQPRSIGQHPRARSSQHLDGADIQRMEILRRKRLCPLAADALPVPAERLQHMNLRGAEAIPGQKTCDGGRSVLIRSQRNYAGTGVEMRADQLHRAAMHGHTDRLRQSPAKA